MLSLINLTRQLSLAGYDRKVVSALPAIRLKTLGTTGQTLAIPLHQSKLESRTLRFSEMRRFSVDANKCIGCGLCAAAASLMQFICSGRPPALI